MKAKTKNMTVGSPLKLILGFAIPIAQRFGAGDEEEMRKFVYNAAVMADILQDAWKYIFIVFLVPLFFWGLKKRRAEIAAKKMVQAE